MVQSVRPSRVRHAPLYIHDLKFDKSRELSWPVICYSGYQRMRWRFSPNSSYSAGTALVTAASREQVEPPTSLVSFKAGQIRVGIETRTKGVGGKQTHTLVSL